jgi:hypothetical protein
MQIDGGADTALQHSYAEFPNFADATIEQYETNPGGVLGRILDGGSVGDTVPYRESQNMYELPSARWGRESALYEVAAQRNATGEQTYELAAGHGKTKKIGGALGESYTDILDDNGGYQLVEGDEDVDEDENDAVDGSDAGSVEEDGTIPFSPVVGVTYEVATRRRVGGGDEGGGDGRKGKGKGKKLKQKPAPLGLLHNGAALRLASSSGSVPSYVVLVLSSSPPSPLSSS